MTTTHTERLLLAEMDYQAAQDFRGLAEEVVRMHERAVELHTAVGGEAPIEATKALERAKIECTQFNRICLRHSARRLDAAKRAEGEESEMESAVMFFDITHPVGV